MYVILQPNGSLLIKSPDGSTWAISIDNNGNLITTKVSNA